MSVSKTLIVSNALTKLGHSPIQTLDEPDDMTLAAEQAYDLLLPGVLSRNNWRFATQIAQLSQSVETPPDPWKTIYYLPAGYLKLIRTYPLIYDFDIYQERKLYTSMSGELYMEYIFEPDASFLPPRFVEYFVNEIAAYIALSNAQHMDYYDRLEAKRKETLAMAAASEAQNRPQFSQSMFPVLDKRGTTDSVDASSIIT